MANAVLEREIARIQAERTRENERFVRDSARKTEERDAHNERNHGNYQRLLFGDKNALSGRTAVREIPAPAQEIAPAPVAEEKPKQDFVPSAAERVAQYTPVKSAAPAKRRMLFEGLTFKDGRLIGAEKPQEAPAQESVPVQETVAVSAPAAPVSLPESDDDAVPTRRTMDTLRRAEEQRVSAEQKTSVSFALSSKMKLVLAAVALVIVLAIAIICVNTSVINSLNADISQLQEVSRTLASQSAEIEGNIAEVTAWENVMEFAKRLGMIVPN